MAITRADIVPGARMRWRTRPGPAVADTAGPFRIISLRGDDVTYVYDAGPRRWVRQMSELLAHAELVTEPVVAPPAPPPPPEVCGAGCNPAVPCLAHAGCPGHLPEYTGNDGFSTWLCRDWRGTASVHDAVLPPFGTAPTLTAPEGRLIYILGRFVVGPPPVGPEPMRNGSGALACDWIERSRRG